MAGVRDSLGGRHIRRVSFSESARAELAHVAAPVVITGALTSWPATHWTPSFLAAEFGGARVRARFHTAQANAVEPETEGLELELTLREFCAWLDSGACSTVPALAGLPHGCSGYVSYHRVPDVFGLNPRVLGAFCWRALGLDVEAEAGTFWLGSCGAHTPLHQDAYGANCVAQLYGTKRWVLFPPSASPALRPTRVPYEESSVFSAATQAEQLAAPGRLELDLCAGELLVVPKHWWHSVVTVSQSSVSVNQWLALPDDRTDRAREALVRLVACALLPLAPWPGAGATGGAPEGCAGANGSEGVCSPADQLWEGEGEGAAQAGSGAPWLNPGEEAWPASDALAALAAALDEDEGGAGDSPAGAAIGSTSHAAPAASSGGCSSAADAGELARDMADVVNALCTGPALDAALMALHEARARRRRRQLAS